MAVKVSLREPGSPKVSLRERGSCKVSLRERGSLKVSPLRERGALWPRHMLHFLEIYPDPPQEYFMVLFCYVSI